jgi:hypothetical protein
MSDENKNVKRIQFTTIAEAVAGLSAKMFGIESTTRKLITQFTAGTASIFTPDGGDASFNSMQVTGLPLAGNVEADDDGSLFISPAIDTDAFKMLWKGFVRPNTITTGIDDATRTYTILTNDASTVDFRCYGIEFSFGNGDPKLSITLPAEKRPYFLYFDAVGQLSYETLKNSDSVLQNNTIAPYLNLATDDDINYYQNIIINRHEDLRANEIENFASSKTKRITGGDNTVLFSGTQGGSTVSYSSGEYFTHIDHQFFIDAFPTPVFPIFFLRGVDADDARYIDRNIKVDSTPYLSDESNLFYNLNTAGLFSKAALGNNKYVQCHFGAGDADGKRIVVLTGQAEYGNLSSAQSAIEGERAGLIVNKEIFKITGIVATCIFKSSGSVGQLQYVNSDNDLFDYPVGDVVSSGSPSVQLQNLQTTLVQSPAGDAGGNPITNLPEALVGSAPAILDQLEEYGIIDGSGHIVLNGGQQIKIAQDAVEDEEAMRFLQVRNLIAALTIGVLLQQGGSDALGESINNLGGLEVTGNQFELTRTGQDHKLYLFVSSVAENVIMGAKDSGGSVLTYLRITEEGERLEYNDGSTDRPLAYLEDIGELRLTVAGNTTINITSSNTTLIGNAFQATFGIINSQNVESLSFGTNQGRNVLHSNNTSFTTNSISNGWAFVNTASEEMELTIKAIGNTDITQLTVSF